MKLSTSLKRFIAMTGICLVLSGLLFYSVSSLIKLEETEKQQQDFINTLRSNLNLAQENYKLLLAETTVDIEKGILAPITSVKSTLSSIYYEDKMQSIKISSSDESKALVKLTLVELDNLLETVKTKNSEFAKAQSQFQNFANYILSEQQSHRTWVITIAWITVFLAFISVMAYTILDFIRSKKNSSVITSLENSKQQETKRVQKLTGFIEAISSGNYSIDLNTGDQDELNETLVAMRDRLQKNAEEDQQRNWASAGLAQASELLRINNAQELYDSVIKFVVKYTGSNQGGLFVLTEEDQDKQLELVSCYAYERKKFLSRKVGIGQGMIGQCFLEKEKIHLQEIPSDYVNITSGLGAANPTSLLLIPLKTNEVVYGVLELASFKTYKDHEVAWVERLAESVASTVATVRANDNMRQLLEQTQQQAEEMKSQEEEMRQNMEELSATQEEMSRKEREYINRIKELESQQQVPTH